MSASRSVMQHVKLEDATAAISASAAGYTWLVQVNEWVQLVAGLIAIVAGSISLYKHFKHKKN